VPNFLDGNCGKAAPASKEKSVPLLENRNRPPSGFGVGVAKVNK
jgi:hypothetical protein